MNCAKQLFKILVYYICVYIYTYTHQKRMHVCIYISIFPLRLQELVLTFSSFLA